MAQWISVCTARHLLRPAVPLCVQSQRRTFIDVRRIAASQPQIKSDRLADFTRDEAITASMVRVKDESGRLGQPEDLGRLLRGLDRRTKTVVQLSKPGENEYVVVQVADIMALLKQTREKENLVRQQKLAMKDKKPKTIELNWAISEHDLDLKLKQMEGFLSKGKTVEVLLAAKKRQRKAGLDEAEGVLKKIRQKIQELEAKETKPMEGHVLKQATLTIQK